MFLATACGGSGSSLPAAGFTPNASTAIQFVDPDGGVEPEAVGILLSDSTPAYSCAFLDGGGPASVIVLGELDIVIAQSPTLAKGTYSITDWNTLSDAVFLPTAGEAAIIVKGPTSPPSDRDTQVQSSISGTLTLTQVGNPWAGSFSATMALLDGGHGALSASFDTSLTCDVQL